MSIVDEVSDLLEDMKNELDSSIADIPNQIGPDPLWYERFLQLRSLMERDPQAAVVLDWPGKTINIRTMLGTWNESLASLADGLCWLTAINHGGMFRRSVVDGCLVAVYRKRD